MAQKKIVTNGDMIRNMSDHEMAEFFAEVEIDMILGGDFCNEICRYRNECPECDGDCKYYKDKTYIQGNKIIWMDWLRMQKKAEG